MMTGYMVFNKSHPAQCILPWWIILQKCNAKKRLTWNNKMFKKWTTIQIVTLLNLLFIQQSPEWELYASARFESNFSPKPHWKIIICTKNSLIPR